jgi:hypothetical protein
MVKNPFDKRFKSVFGSRDTRAACLARPENGDGLDTIQMGFRRRFSRGWGTPRIGTFAG